MSLLTNCIPCTQDRHNECTNPKICLCAVETNHNEKKHDLTDSVNEIIDALQATEPLRNYHRKITGIIDQQIEEKDPKAIDKASSKIQQDRRFVTDSRTDQILLWNGKIYDEVQAEALIKEETEKLIPNCTEHYRREVISKIKAQTYRDLEEFDSNSNEITVLNGILNLETLELRKHTPENLSRILLPVNFQKPKHEDIEENLKNTLFWKTLTKSFTINGEFRVDDMFTVLEVMASTFLKKPIDQKAVMFLGSGENGKSVCLSYLVSLLGKDNVSSIPLQDIANDKFMAANLDGKSANIFTDLEKNELRHTGRIKAIVSNEGIEVQKKGKQGYTLYPSCKLIFSCNRFPKVFDQEQGFFRRWIIVHWDRNFENDPERVESLLEKLLTSVDEKTLVFSSLIQLAAKLNKTGKFTHTPRWKDVKEQWNANANPVGVFVAECIMDSEKHRTKRETHQKYSQWCYDKGESPLGIGQFGKVFAEYYDDATVKEDKVTHKVWLNIDFKEMQQINLKEYDST
jgi:putative DNA primase/helicase